MWIRKSSIFCVDVGGSFPMLGSQSLKAKGFKVWLKHSRPLQLYYYIFSNYLKSTSQLVKREAISLPTYAKQLCRTRVQPFLSWHIPSAYGLQVCADGTVGSFPFSEWNSRQLNSQLTTSKCHLCLVTSDPSPHPVLCSWDLPGPVQGDSGLWGIHMRSSMTLTDFSGPQCEMYWSLYVKNCGGFKMMLFFSRGNLIFFRCLFNQWWRWI